MRLFYGPHRKLSLFPILLFAVGWAVYLVGFVRKMAKPSPSFPRWDNYPALVAVAVGPLVLLFSLLQSCLGGTPSAIMGSVAAASAVVFLVGLGNSSITTAQILYQYNSTTEELSIAYPSSTLTGCILCSLAITMLLSLWGYYREMPPSTRSRRRQQHVTLHTDDEDGSSPSEEVHRERTASVFAGYARKMAVSFILLAGVGWGVVVGGHHQRISRVPEEGRYANDLFFFDFGQWGTLVLTPLLLFFALVHAGSSGRTSSVMGLVTSILNGFVLTSIGYYMIHDVGKWLKEQCDNKDCNFTLPRTAAALSEVVGSFVFCFFWACAVGVWPFYRNDANIRASVERGDKPTPLGYIQRKLNSRFKKSEEDDLEPLEV